MKSKKSRLILWGVLLAANLAFIWGNSALPGNVSGNISGGLLSALIRVFPFLGSMKELVLRKLGHFSEFACLGLVLSWGAVLLGQRSFHRFTLPLLAGVLTACVDETIQIFTPGRGSSLLDVWIDVFGVCVGILLFQLGKMIIGKHLQSGGNK